MPKIGKTKEPVAVIAIRRSSFESFREYCAERGLNQTEAATMAINNFLCAVSAGQGQDLDILYKQGGRM
jgi:hypothetical protein